MILIALGANLPSTLGPPVTTLAAALDVLGGEGVTILACSRWYRTAPVPASDQPWFINGVARVATQLGPVALLAMLHRIEQRFGRRPGAANAARPIDLDLLAYDDRLAEGDEGVILPHPRLQERAFVLLPLHEVAPGWRHPKLHRSVEAMIAALPAGQAAMPLDG